MGARSTNKGFRKKLESIALQLDVEFGDQFLDYVRRVWRVLPEWFRTPDEWEDLASFCRSELGSYNGHGGLIIGVGIGGDLRVARFEDGTRSVSRVVEWIAHENVLASERTRANRPAVPLIFCPGDRVVHAKLGLGHVQRSQGPSLSCVRWDDGNESVRHNRFLKLVCDE